MTSGLDETNAVQRLFHSNLDSILTLCQRLPWNGQLMSTCEAELQELMRQIDIMVQNKKLEWERELQTTENKLQLRERECTMHRSTVEQKSKEIVQLRQQVENIERNNRETVVAQERNLDKVKNDFDALRRDYEKLQKKMSKHSREAAKDKTKTSSQLQGTQIEMQRALSRLEDFRQKSKDWELEKRNLEKQIESLESQRRTLQEKCDLIEQQTTGYQSQLDRRRQILDNTEYNLKTQITQLEEKLERANDIISSQESQVDKFKQSLDEAVGVQRRLLDEKEYAERELRDNKKRFHSVEDELSHMRLEFQKREEYFRLAELDQKNNLAEIQRLERTLSEKQEIIQNMGDRHSHRDTDSRRYAQICDELKQAKSQMKSSKKTEWKLNEEIARQKSQLQQAEMDVEKLRLKFQEKMGNLKTTEGKQNKELEAEVSKLKQNLAAQNGAHDARVAELERKCTSLKATLDERTQAVVSLETQLAHVQRHNRDESEKYERRAAELQVANAQLEALRLENRHLRQTAMKQIQTNTDVMEAEAHLKELQNAYTASMSRMESENKDLHHELELIQIRLRKMEQESLEKEHHSRTVAERSIQEVQTSEERRLQHVKSDYEKRLSSLQAKMERKVSHVESQLDRIIHEKKILENALRHRTEKMKRVFTENEVMSNFVEDVSEVVNSPTKSPDSSPTRGRVAPRMVGALDSDAQLVTSRYDGPLLSVAATSTRASTRVHFDDKDLAGESLSQDSVTAESSFVPFNQQLTNSPNRVGEVGSTRVKPTPFKISPSNRSRNKDLIDISDSLPNEYGNLSMDGRRSVSPGVQPSLNKRNDISELNGSSDQIAGSKRAASPARLAPSPSGRGVSPSLGGRVPSPLRVPSPSHVFQRISPVPRPESARDARTPARAGSASNLADAITSRHDERRPKSAQGAPIGASGIGGASGSRGAVWGAVGGNVDETDMLDIADLSLTDQSEFGANERPGSRASLATRFYEEEQERAKELEMLINSHIEDLKQETGRTVTNYTR